MSPLGEAMEPQPTDMLIGQTVGNYLVTQKLGEGGMGSVYLAEHPGIGKKVALKVLHNEFSANREVAERFFHEAKAVNAIGHPNIVDIVDYGMIQAGTSGHEQLVYFIMEYLAGGTLSDLIRAEAPLPPERALMIALQVADALAASHKCGIVHRDLKPDNIILISRGRERDFVKLLDFGIAKLTGDAQGSHRTRTGIVLGTPAYMSPEQCEGRANVDHRTDVYALGICLYEMLTGRVPFIGEGYGEILVQHLTQQAIPPSQYRMMSPHVELVVMKALEKRPEMRYPTMEEMMRAIADPIGYVEAHGGLGGFLQRQLMPSTAPVPIRLTPTPLTPAPGSLMMSPVPGMGTGPGIGMGPLGPTTLGAATGQVQSTRSRNGFIIAGVIVVAAATVGIMLVITKNRGGTPADNGSSAVAMNGSGSNGATTPPPLPNTGGGSAVTPPLNTGGGSAVTPALNTGSGSAVTPPPNTGSGSAMTPPPNTGSGSAVTPPPPENVKLTVKSHPGGAEIFLDGVDANVKTPNVIDVPMSKHKVRVTLKLSGYADADYPDVPLEKAEVSTGDIALREVKHTVPGVPGLGKTPGKTPTTGDKTPTKNPTGHSNDTGLMKPEDM